VTRGGSGGIRQGITAATGVFVAYLALVFVSLLGLCSFVRFEPRGFGNAVDGPFRLVTFVAVCLALVVAIYVSRPFTPAARVAFWSVGIVYMVAAGVVLLVALIGAPCGDLGLLRR
jgi:threonine/homoserine/homoserine lactone efflux protein